MSDQKTEQKHTPGPWQVGPVFDNDGQPEIIIEHMTPRGNLVVAVAIGGLRGQVANARLLAAAPELLEALQFVMSAHGEQLDSAFQQAQEAITKATGERHD